VVYKPSRFSSFIATRFPSIALYCIRTGNIQQHRQWMIRSYPFAMVFVFTRAILAIPAIERMGEVGIVSVVWSCIAAACFVPSFVINWRAIFKGARNFVPEAASHTRMVEADEVAATAGL
jgi:uncharacterized membrane protein YozB (DUF420 family)